MSDQRNHWGAPEGSSINDLDEGQIYDQSDDGHPEQEFMDDAPDMDEPPMGEPGPDESDEGEIEMDSDDGDHFDFDEIHGEPPAVRGSPDEGQGGRDSQPKGGSKVKTIALAVGGVVGGVTLLTVVGLVALNALSPSGPSASDQPSQAGLPDGIDRDGLLAAQRTADEARARAGQDREQRAIDLANQEAAMLGGSTPETPQPAPALLESGGPVPPPVTTPTFDDLGVEKVAALPNTGVSSVDQGLAALGDVTDTVVQAADERTDNRTEQLTALTDVELSAPTKPDARLAGNEAPMSEMPEAVRVSIADQGKRIEEQAARLSSFEETLLLIQASQEQIKEQLDKSVQSSGEAASSSAGVSKSRLDALEKRVYTALANSRIALDRTSGQGASTASKDWRDLPDSNDRPASAPKKKAATTQSDSQGDHRTTVRQTTGSAPSSQPAPRVTRSAGTEDWRIVAISQGQAMVKSPQGQTFLVQPGQILPDAGQVESVDQNARRVVTASGVISQMN